MIQCLMKSASAPPPLPPSPFLWVSGSWIMKQNICRFPSDHRWGGEADHRRPSVLSQRIAVGTKCPPAPPWSTCLVRTMARWTWRSCVLTGVNVSTWKVWTEGKCFIFNLVYWNGQTGSRQLQTSQSPKNSSFLDLEEVRESLKHNWLIIWLHLETEKISSRRTTCESDKWH